MITTLIRQPSVHFLVLAGIIFGVNSLLANEEATLTLSETTYQHILALEAARKGSQLTTVEAEQAIQNHIDNELLLTDALSAGVHRDATIAQMIVRKHKAFLTATLPMPDDDELKTFFDQHRDQFREPTRYSLNYQWHEQPSGSLLKTAETTGNQERSRASGHLVDVTFDQLSAYFGTPLTQQIAQATPGPWQGPFVDDALPALWVQITATETGKTPMFEDHRAYVLDAFRKDQANRFLASYLEDLKQQTRVEIQQ